MIKYYRRVSFFKVYETWFTYTYKFWDVFSIAIFLNIKDNSHKKIRGIQYNGARNQGSHTIELNLQQDTSIIFANFSKQIRQQVKIAESEGIICYFHKEVSKFVAFFNEFAIKKETFTTSEQILLQLGDAVMLSFASKDGQILAAHSYLVDKEAGIVRHLHSATKRLDEGYDRNMIGRANKYLTVKDILYFKEAGFKIFDFGGYAKDAEDESLKGINNYKLLFGGEIVDCYDYYSYSYWFLKKISKFLGLSGKL